MSSRLPILVVAPGDAPHGARKNGFSRPSAPGGLSDQFHVTLAGQFAKGACGAGRLLLPATREALQQREACRSRQAEALGHFAPSVAATAAGS
jgi:hypothetical protein